MKYALFVVSIWITLLASGCSTLRQNETQYQVVGPPGQRGAPVPVSSGDRAAVQQITSNLASQWRLQDRTSTSFLPTAIGSYSQDWNETPYPTKLVAFEHQGKIIVDLTQESPGVGETAQYRARQEQLLTALREKFGQRLIIPRLMDYVRHVQASPQ